MEAKSVTFLASGLGGIHWSLLDARVQRAAVFYRAAVDVSLTWDPMYNISHLVASIIGKRQSYTVGTTRLIALTDTVRRNEKSLMPSPLLHLIVSFFVMENIKQ